jgi:hypothetical protein
MYLGKGTQALSVGEGGLVTRTPPFKGINKCKALPQKKNRLLSHDTQMISTGFHVKNENKTKSPPKPAFHFSKHLTLGEGRALFVVYPPEFTLHTRNLREVFKPLMY